MEPTITGQVASKAISHGVKNDLIKTIEKQLPPVPPHLFKIHQLTAMVGACNSGKTNATIRLVKSYQDNKVYNHVFLISPTGKQNKAFEELKIPDQNIFSGDEALNDVGACLRAIIDRITRLGKRYEENEEYKKAYQAWKKAIASQAQLILLHNNGYAVPANIPLPCCALILDDLSHTELYGTGRKNPFINLALRHRHIGNVGVSIYMIVQNFKGLPKVLRQNVSVFCFWKTHDETQIDSIFEEAAKVCHYDDFMRLFRYATEEPFCFLCVDTSEINPKKQFIKNFDEFIYLPNPTPIITRKQKRKYDGGGSSTYDHQSVQ